VLLASADRVFDALAWPSADASVLVACSGGLDSVVLLDVAVDRLGAGRVAVGHVDHGVRSDSAEDAAFVRALAAARGLAMHARRLDPPAADEATLRRLRYAALADMRRAAGAAFVLLGHHRDDQAETVLLQLVRRGRLEGMAPIRDVFVRPFLRVPRRLLERHARRRRLRWREDPSNRAPAFLRNRIRKELLPLLETRYRPGIARRLAGLAAAGRPEPPRPVEAGAPAAPGPSALRGPAGGRADPPTPRFRWSEHRGEPVPLDPQTAWFDADVVVDFAVRTPQPGDRIRPFGMSGRKKVSDVFREHRVPQALRARMPLVVSGGEVLWIPGLVRSSAGVVGPTTRIRWEMWTNWE
jgi:tRNA(Ile)-lysidine synthase